MGVRIPRPEQMNRKMTKFINSNLTKTIGAFAMHFLVKQVWKLIKRYGMQHVLEAMISATDNMPEDYMRRLNLDLRSALNNYKNRNKD